MLVLAYEAILPGARFTLDSGAELSWGNLATLTELRARLGPRIGPLFRRTAGEGHGQGDGYQRSPRELLPSVFHHFSSPRSVLRKTSCTSSLLGPANISFGARLACASANAGLFVQWGEFWVPDRHQ